MKKIWAITSLAAALLVPNTAHAGFSPYGITLCDPASGKCMTTEISDKPTLSGTPTMYGDGLLSPPGPVRNTSGQFTWSRTGCTLVLKSFQQSMPGVCQEISCVYTQWIVERSHTYRRKAVSYRAIITRCVSGDTVYSWKSPDTLYYFPQYDSADCNPSGENEAWFYTKTDASGTRALAMRPNTDAPEQFVAACGGVRQSYCEALQLPADCQTATETTTETGTTTETPTATEPVAVAKCASITYAKRKVAVKSAGIKCASGRNIMARWLTKGIEPAGWVCVTAKNGKTRTAACAKPAKAKGPRITGSWKG